MMTQMELIDRLCAVNTLLTDIVREQAAIMAQHGIEEIQTDALRGRAFQLRLKLLVLLPRHDSLLILVALRRFPVLHRRKLHLFDVLPLIDCRRAGCRVVLPRVLNIR